MDALSRNVDVDEASVVYLYYIDPEFFVHPNDKKRIIGIKATTI